MFDADLRALSSSAHAVMLSRIADQPRTVARPSCWLADFHIQHGGREVRNGGPPAAATEQPAATGAAAYAVAVRVGTADVTAGDPPNDHFVRRPQRGLVIGVTAHEDPPRFFPIDTRQARRRLVRAFADVNLVVPAAYVLDDITAGVISAMPRSLA